MVLETILKIWIKDFVYIKVWGWPRNDLLVAYEKKFGWDNIDLDEFNEHANQLFCRKTKFTILECQIDKNNLLEKFTHCQNGTEEAFNCMDERYTHTNKPMPITYKGTINPDNIKIIGSAEPLIDKSNKINILLNW